MNVLGIDLSSKAIDLVLLDENADKAAWQRITLEGDSAFERARDVADKMPAPGWFADHGVYLVAVERPFVRHGQDVIRLVQGCVLARLPRALPVWEVSVSQWKRRIGLPIREKPSAGSFPFNTPIGWAQDAYDALGVALYARDENAAAVAAVLRGAA